MEDRRGACWVLVDKPDGKRSLVGPKHRWDDNIMIYIQEVGWAVMDWIDLAQDRDR